MNFIRPFCAGGFPLEWKASGAVCVFQRKTPELLLTDRVWLAFGRKNKIRVAYSLIIVYYILNVGKRREVCLFEPGVLLRMSNVNVPGTFSGEHEKESHYE